MPESSPLTPDHDCMASRRLRFADPKYVRKLARGVTWMLWGILACSIALAVTDDRTSSDIGWADAIIRLAAGGVGFLGVWWITAVEPNVSEGTKAIASRRTVRGLVSFLLLLEAMPLLRLYRGLPQRSTPTPDAAAAAGGEPIISVILLIALMGFVLIVFLMILWALYSFAVYLGDLARRTPDRRLARNTGYLMRGTAVLVLTGTVSMFSPLVCPSLVADGSPYSPILSVVGYVVFAAAAACAVCWMILLFIYRRRFAAEAILAEKIWAKEQGVQ